MSRQRLAPDLMRASGILLHHKKGLLEVEMRKGLHVAGVTVFERLRGTAVPQQSHTTTVVHLVSKDSKVMLARTGANQYGTVRSPRR